MQVCPAKFLSQPATSTARYASGHKVLADACALQNDRDAPPEAASHSVPTADWNPHKKERGSPTEGLSHNTSERNSCRASCTSVTGKGRLTFSSRFEPKRGVLCNSSLLTS